MKLKVFRFINPNKKESHDQDDYVTAYDLEQAKKLLDKFAGNDWCSKFECKEEDLRKWWRYLKDNNKPHYMEIGWNY